MEGNHCSPKRYTRSRSFSKQSIKSVLIIFTLPLFVLSPIEMYVCVNDDATINTIATAAGNGANRVSMCFTLIDWSNNTNQI